MNKNKLSNNYFIYIKSFDPLYLMSLPQENYQHFSHQDNQELESFGSKQQQHKKSAREDTKTELDLERILSQNINTDIFSSNTAIVIIFVVIILIIFYSFFLYSSAVALPANINKSEIDFDKSFAHNSPRNPAQLRKNQQKKVPILAPQQIVYQQKNQQQQKQQKTKTKIEKEDTKIKKEMKKSNFELLQNDRIKSESEKQLKQNLNNQKTQSHPPKPDKKISLAKQFSPPDQQITHQMFVESFERRGLSGLQIGEKSSIADTQRQYYQKKYGLSQFPQLPFCIILPTENNSGNRKYLRNIRSVIMQDYSNYHFVVIDNASSDKTGTLIKQQLSKQKKLSSSSYKIIIHTEKKTELQIIVKAARQYCKQNEIMVVVDGSDELIGAQVLKLFNSQIQKHDLLVAYSNSLMMPGMVGYSYPYPPKVIEQASFSSYTFVAQQLRAFYVSLLLNIKQEDLKDKDGFYFDALPQLAYMLPILQQAHTKIGYIPQIAYYFNRDKQHTQDHRVLQQKAKSTEKILRMRQKYPSFNSTLKDNL